MEPTMTPEAADTHQLAINTIRFLAVDMVEKARSGHPGAPMGQAAMAYVLWTRILRHNPSDPHWPDRDRFILSCGHASALLYALLHLSGYDLSLQDLRDFRQLESRTPGHPEHGLTPGVEMTTGPLGQGLATAVGLAIGQKMLAGRFNKRDLHLVNHRIWVMAGDGDLMEGVTSEAASLAGHLGLGRLNVLYDDNRISIDGSTSLTFTEDVLQRHQAYGWHVQRVEDGNDLEAVEIALAAARDEEDRPSLIAARTHIGFGSPGKQDSSAAHGSPLGADEVEATKTALGWPQEPTFLVPDDARRAFLDSRQRGAAQQDQWQELYERFEASHPGLADELRRRLAGEMPPEWIDDLPRFAPEDGPMATRKASGIVLNSIAGVLPELVGGSADLTGSNNTYLEGHHDISRDSSAARNIYFGVREHAMGAVLNGLALNGAFRPFGGTFLVFADYLRPAIRLAALMGLPVTYVFTHDSVLLGEDGPTHQPESHALSLRALPGLTVIRPADAIESAAAWRSALERRDGPTALILSRQKLPILEQTRKRAAEGLPRGGYVLAEPREGKPAAILIATGSEVATSLEAQALLADEGLPVRVVSLPSWELFDRQDRSYRDEVLPPTLRKRLAIEAASPLGWERYVGDEGEVLGVDGFGSSAPAKDLAEVFGLTPAKIAQRLQELAGTGTE